MRCGKIFTLVQDNHQAISRIQLASPILTHELKFEFERPLPNMQVVVFEVGVE